MTTANNNNAPATLSRTTSSSSNTLQWSEIDKTRFFTIGTAIYSGLCIALHPVTVIKTRQQVLDNTNTNTARTVTKTHSKQLQHQQSLSTILTSSTSSLTKFKSLYRGLPIILLAAVPARALYITVLENTRADVHTTLNERLVEAYFGPEEAHSYLPLITTFSGGVAGGLAAVSAQIIVVPMDVISQRQMILSDSNYKSHGKALQICQKVLQQGGIKNGLYKGFGLSIMSSLPTGSVWWAVYGVCQEYLHSFSSVKEEKEEKEIWRNVVKRGGIQLISGVSAAIIAATLTQPLDVVKTRLQVGHHHHHHHNSSSSSFSNTPRMVAKELWNTSGIKGFFRGVGPRIMHMGLWGTLLSSAYEFLRHVSRKDYYHLDE